MDSIRDELILPNGIEDPVKTEEAGIFTNPEIQALYDELVLKGSSSIQNAVSVGLLIEDMDIFDLEAVISTVEDETVKEVLGHLKGGSENHMRAFYKQAEKYGVEYEPEYITQQEMNAILAVPSGGGQNSEGNQEHEHNSDEECDGDCDSDGQDNEHTYSNGSENDNGNNGGNDNDNGNNGNSGENGGGNGGK
jgi:hypothetical protein